MTLRIFAFAFVVALATASPLHAQGYCAQYASDTSLDCSFSTLQMCEASVTGVGGVCIDNPYPQTAAEAPPPPLPLPPGQTKYQLFPATSPTLPASPPPPCNPLIDGTYCATAAGGFGAGGAAPPSGMAPIQSISSDLAIGTDPPATLGAINFSGGSTCMALFRRMTCGG
jgi:Protein of unknown function (DUF3551)